MNPIPIPEAIGSRTERFPRTSAAEGEVIPFRRPPPEWLPVPAVRRQTGREVPPSNATMRPTFWLASANECRAEKLLMGMLVAAAMSGVAYGFACLVDLVQNWASFYAGVEHFF